MTAESLIDLPPRARELPWGTAASVALHGLLLVAAVLVSPLRPLVVPPPAPVAVEIVTPAQFANLQRPGRAEVAAPARRLAAPAPMAATNATSDDSTRLPPSPPLQPDLPETKTWRATRFYAATILSEPGMAHIRKAFGTLASSEKLMQLCNIEGLEQIRRTLPQYDPDTLVPYAMREPLVTGLRLSAAGGAFRSRRKWYEIAFQCTVAADLGGVTAFEFRVGEAIPPDQWDAHNLNAEDADE
jgi:hypothetical protein